MSSFEHLPFSRHLPSKWLVAEHSVEDINTRNKLCSQSRRLITKYLRIYANVQDSAHKKYYFNVVSVSYWSSKITKTACSGSDKQDACPCLPDLGKSPAAVNGKGSTQTEQKRKRRLFLMGCGPIGANAKATNIKGNFRFRFRSVWVDLEATKLEADIC
ncbi:MAG: hypothetical protein MJE68_24050 [Proteobacteria bacterium]|nr:hypothetical protein [Pseudomonadota bacterium]